MKGKYIVCEIPVNSRRALRVSLYLRGGYPTNEIWLVEQRAASSGQFMPTGSGVTVRVEKLPELIAGLVAAVGEAAQRGWLPPNALERCGLKLNSRN